MPVRGRDSPERQHGANDAGRAGRNTARAPGANSGVPHGNSSSNSNSNMMGGNLYGQGVGRNSGIPPDRTKCKDVNCDKRIAWRNVDANGNIIGSSHSNNSSSSGGMGQLLPFHHNHEEREIQMKLLDILSETGLSQEDIDVLGSKPLAFSSLPAVSSSTGAIRGVPSNTGMEAPQQRSVAWLCAQFDADRDRREWAFHNRSPHVARIPSAHCEEQFCHFKKPIYDTVCNKHLCQVAGCELLCDMTESNQKSNYCPKHKCHYKGCAKMAQDHVGYCDKHKCQSEHGCNRIAMSSYKLCKNHLKCSQQGCTRPRFIVPKGRTIDDKDYAECGIGVYDREPYLAYCEEHGVCADKSCSKLRIKTTVHCRKHACLERGCRNPCPEKLKYCNLHRCGMEACMSPKGWKQDDRTREEFCLNPGVPDMHLYCQQHECDFEGCVAIMAEHGVCIEHLKIQHMKHAKASVHREAQQMAKAFQVNSGTGANGNAGMFYAHPSHSPPYSPFNNPYYHSPTHSMSSRSRSPPDWKDYDYDRDRNRARGRGRDYHGRDHGHHGRRGSRQDSVHTPTSSDGGRSRYYDEDSDVSPVLRQKQQQQQQPHQRKTAPAQATAQTQHSGAAQKTQQQARPQQPAVVINPAPQGTNKPVGSGNRNNNAGGSAPNFVLLGKTAPVNKNVNGGQNPPIILQNQPMYQDDDYSDEEDNWVR
ncbi:hypothetical protein SCUCBS95973_006613 [Sporothrix curviconia]|uniref:Uncharacterized protein n=1 Tax=Sporothrix curviconia TaxID=1260050 RepID=A0ABP0C6K9_9PEZI